MANRDPRLAPNRFACLAVDALETGESTILSSIRSVDAVGYGDRCGVLAGDRVTLLKGLNTLALLLCDHKADAIARCQKQIVFLSDDRCGRIDCRAALSERNLPQDGSVGGIESKGFQT